MANDKNGRMLGMNNTVKMTAVITNIHIGTETITVRLEDGTEITIPSINVEWVSGKGVQPA